MCGGGGRIEHLFPLFQLEYSWEILVHELRTLPICIFATTLKAVSKYCGRECRSEPNNARFFFIPRIQAAVICKCKICSLLKFSLLHDVILTRKVTTSRVEKGYF